MKRATMLKRTALLRRTPLVGVGSLKRSKIRQMSSKRRKANVVRRRNVLAAFGDHPVCFVQGCGRPATDGHELLSRARGGSITDVDNIRPVCRDCHTTITESPAWAESLGYALPSPRRKP